jgi:hypothetical protein
VPRKADDLPAASPVDRDPEHGIYSYAHTVPESGRVRAAWLTPRKEKRSPPGPASRRAPAGPHQAR